MADASIHDRAPFSCLLAGLVLSACSFSSESHPSACKTDGDCKRGYSCYKEFCVEESGSSVQPPGGTGGSVAPPSGGTSGSGGGAGGSGGGAAGGTGGGTGGHAGNASGAGGGPPTGGSGASGDGGPVVMPDASTPDTGGTDSGAPPTLPPYSSCTGDLDCNADEVCRKSGASGVCSAPCGAEGDCAMPAGSYQATRRCDMSRCRLTCAPPLPTPFTLSCPSGMVCLIDSGGQSCYPQ